MMRNDSLSSTELPQPILKIIKAYIYRCLDCHLCYQYNWSTQRKKKPRKAERKRPKSTVKFKTNKKRSSEVNLELNIIVNRGKVTTDIHASF